MRQALKELGHAGAHGWRERVADEVAPRLASRSPARADQIKAAVGLAFFLASLVYVVQTLRSLVKR